MAPHSSTLAWKIPWTEEPGRLQPMGSRRVGHDWETSLSLFTFMHWRRKWQPTPVFLPGESQGRGAWWAAIYGVAQSWTQLKWLSSSSSRSSRTLLWRPLSSKMRKVERVYFNKVSPHFQAHTREKGMPEHVVVYSAVWRCSLWQLGTWSKVMILPWLGKWTHIFLTWKISEKQVKHDRWPFLGEQPKFSGARELA